MAENPAVELKCWGGLGGVPGGDGVQGTTEPEDEVITEGQGLKAGPQGYRAYQEFGPDTAMGHDAHGKGWGGWSVQPMDVSARTQRLAGCSRNGVALPGLGARWGEKKQPPEKAGGKGRAKTELCLTLGGCQSGERACFSPVACVLPASHAQRGSRVAGPCLGTAAESCEETGGVPGWLPAGRHLG